MDDIFMEGVSNCCGAEVYQGERCSDCKEGCGIINQCELCGDYHEDDSECEATAGKMD